MSVFGTTPPKFVSGTTTVTLDKTKIKADWPIADVIIQTSAVNGVKNFIFKGDYAEFDVIIHISKYADPSSIFNTLMQYHGKEVDKFYPFGDGAFLQDSDGNPIKVFLDMKMFFLDDFNKYDAIKMHVTAKKYIDITKMA